MNYENAGVSTDSSASKDSAAKAATVLVHGEMIRDQAPKVASKDSTPSRDSQSRDKVKSAQRAVSEAKITMQSHLPGLDDDSDVGVQKEHVITRDDKADLAFSGTLLASVAPPSAPQGTWAEYRVYATTGGKHVFSKVTRSVFADDQDKHETDVFDPAPSSMPSQLLKSARELARSRPMEWTDAAAAFFGYDPLAKALYRKLSVEFEEHIS